MAKDELFSSMM
jgi:RecJ-like exonuclease